MTSPDEERLAMAPERETSRWPQIEAEAFGPQSDGRAWPVTKDAERTLAEHAYRAIHGAIVTGKLLPGSRLGLHNLSQLLAMSPTPIREALHRLEAVGLVETVPHHGARIVGLSIADLKDLYEARLALEPLAARRAAEQSSGSARGASVEHLERLVAAERAGSPLEVWDAHTALHFSLYAASESRWLAAAITLLWESSQRYRVGWKQLEEDVSERDQEHRMMVSAFMAREAATAAELVHRHLARTANVIAIGMGAEPLFEVSGEVQSAGGLGAAQHDRG